MAVKRPIGKIEKALLPLAVALDSLHLDPDNAREHGDANIDAIKISLESFGQQKPIVADRKGRILAGNGTYLAAVALGWTQIAAVKSSLTKQKATAFGIADNRTAELAGWDQEKLAELLEELQEEDLAILTGYSAEEIDRLIEEAQGNTIVMVPASAPTEGSQGDDGLIPSEDRYSLTFAMNANELKRWRKMKDAKGLRSDKELLLLLMEGGS